MRELPPLPLPPRTLAVLLALACLLSLAGALTLATDLWIALHTGTFHLVRNPVTRESGGLFTAVAVMEALGIALCLGVGLIEAYLYRRVRLPRVQASRRPGAS